MKSTFVSIASHQLRAPIGGVRGYLMLIREGDFGRVPRKAIPVVDQSIDQLDHLLHIISTFLDVAQFEAGKIKLEKKNIDLNLVAKSAIKENALSASTRKLTVKLHIPSKPIYINADKEKVSQVMFNLIENSIKYTAQGSISVKLENKRDFVEFRVEDTGIGFNKQQAAKLFTKYYRVGSGTKPRKGSGLGLYIVKILTEAHGGEVFANSKGEGKGSVFGFRLAHKGKLKKKKTGK